MGPMMVNWTAPAFDRVMPKRGGTRAGHDALKEMEIGASSRRLLRRCDLLRGGGGGGSGGKMDELAGPGNEVLHVGAVLVAAVVLTPRQFSLQQAGIDG